jgi:hypothetical protein
MVCPNCQVETSVRHSSVYTVQIMTAEIVTAQIMMIAETRIAGINGPSNLG